MKRMLLLALLVTAMTACAGADDATSTDTAEPPADGITGDSQITGDLQPDPDLTGGGDEDAPTREDTGLPPDTLDPGCAPGEGCFLDPCETNDDCLSGWCVGHMGEDVCTLQCQTECPPGWGCEQVPGTAPDFVWVCISRHANLCLPCATGTDCKGAAGADDVCVDYGPEGSFCGGQCDTDDDCPWGFSCADTHTVVGVETRQCVADAGVCPCTEKSVALTLFTPCTVEGEAGTCDGKRVCTTEGLSDCDAPVPSEELCDGLDNDCDGDTDEPLEVGGNYINLCDDGNPCTTDSCDGAGGCSHASLAGGECVDGDACTVGDHCEEGVCTGLPIVCDDDDPCTDDSCDGFGGCQVTFNQASCDDGDPCTVADLCSSGACGGFAVDCQCLTDADCAPLEDGDLCNGTLLCDNDSLPYQCKVDPDSLVVCPEPVGGDICTEVTCDPGSGACVTGADHQGYACDDGDACTIGDQCNDGACLPGVSLACADGTPCTDDACDPQSGCTFTPNNAPCTDGDICTTGDLCVGGQCVGGGDTLGCDDGNPCTTDACDPLVGCLHSPVNVACSDGNACTTGDMCQGGVCVGGGATPCSDGNLCTNDACNPATGCVFTLNQAPCNDGDLCTIDDHCHLGACIAGGALPCADGNPCTDDECDALTGCQFVPNAAPCDDGNTCTSGDHCVAGQCQGDAVGCDDENPCTDDYCDVAVGCIHVANTDPCNDLNACTANEFCSGGACGGGVPIICDDANLCTDNGCSPQTGCTYTPNSAPCTDNDACTDGDVCADGACVPGGALLCEDLNVCTLDTCTPDTGCVHTPVEDGTLCGAEMHCAAGECVTDCQVAAGSQTFNVSLSVTNFTVPDCIESVTVEAWGAQGGKNNPCSQPGGKGARMKGSFDVVPGEVLKVVVGQRGKNRGSDTANQSGTGGGGSFVWRSAGSALMLAAGGGGGGAICTSGGSPGYATGRDGVTVGCGTQETTNTNSGGCDGANGTVDPCFGKGWNAVLLNPAGSGSGSEQGGYGGGGTVGNSHGGGGGGGYGGGACKP
ncbi:MAG: glycine-rich protein, partial [Pseudomonadota bacterium]